MVPGLEDAPMKRHTPATLDRLEPRQLMATFAVTHNGDTGSGSLRWAIQQANATAAADVISFNLSSTTISPLTTLPAITQPVTIDGTTQPGYAGTPRVTIDGASAVGAGAGFNIQATDVLIRGLAIGNFLANGGAGVLVGSVALRATVRDCYIGLATNGTTAMPNHDGFRSFGLASQVLYSTVSGNDRYGVWLANDGGKVFDSTIGLTPSGNPLGNGNSGVYISNGDFCFVQDSIIGGNDVYGIYASLQPTNVTIDRNIIGMNASRTALRSNGSNAVYFRNVTGKITNNRIASAVDHSVIIDNCASIIIEANNIGFGANTAVDFGGNKGILLTGSHNCTVRLNQIGYHAVGIDIHASFQNDIQRNAVGTLLDNSVAMPNGVGVQVDFGNDNFIGTDAVGGADANVISNNSNQGVFIKSGSRNAVLGNRFKDNDGLDIDLGTAGVTSNDAGDIDTGANTLLNTIAPVFGAYNLVNATTTTISFRAWNELAAPAAYRIDFYESDKIKTAWEIGEASRHLASRTISFTGQGELTFDTTIPLEVDGTQIAATVTRLVNGLPTDTSEMSVAMRVQGAPQILGSAFEFETQHAVSFLFSRNVTASITTNDVSIVNLATGQTFSAVSVAPGSENNSHQWRFPSTLPDGNYRATLNRAGVSAWVPLAMVSVQLDSEGPNTVDFHILRGDANRDKRVNFSDLLVLAQNYGQSSRTFSQGDFNYDGAVNFGDLLILAQRYGSQLSGTPSAIAPARQRRADSPLA
jgi:hypothetical protein